jgi:hypothetical protein
MSTNHGRLCRDGQVGNLTIKSRTVIDKDANIDVCQAVVRKDLKVKGNIIAQGPCVNALQYKIDGDVIIDNNSNVIDNKDFKQIKFPKNHVCGFCVNVRTIALGFEGEPPFETTGLLDITPGDCRDSSNCFNICLPEQVTIDFTQTGAGGLDTGSPAADQWYAVHVIGDSNCVNPTSAMVSASLFLPTLPAGYDIFRRVGWARSYEFDVSVYHFIPIIQKGKNKARWCCWDWWHLDRAVSLMITKVWVNIFGWRRLVLSDWVPPSSCSADIKVQFNNVGVSDLSDPNTPLVRMMLRTPNSVTTVADIGDDPDPQETSQGSPIVVWGQAQNGVISQHIKIYTDQFQQIDAVLESVNGPPIPGPLFSSPQRRVQVLVMGFHDELVDVPPSI